MKILAIGRNYVDHIKELNNEVPTEPVIFTKPDTALLRNNDPFYYPEFTSNVHYEVEIVLKINRMGKYISLKHASSYFDEIAVGIDFTARDLQDIAKKKGLPWALAKGFDHSAPISKFIPKSEITDLKKLDFSLKINGTLRQQGNTEHMINDFDYIITYISRFITLKKGDLIFTGTPKGVGSVKRGDLLEAFVGTKKMLKVEIK